MEFIFHEEALKRGISTEDVTHAIANPIAIHALVNGAIIIVGGGRDGRLIEVGYRDLNNNQRLIFHVMTARKKWLP